MRSEPAWVGGISLDFAEITLRWDEDFLFKEKWVQVGQPGKMG